jgi:exopolysaccharide biosynthesis polyprenyl glycosylphosphotransferase
MSLVERTLPTPPLPRLVSPPATPRPGRSGLRRALVTVDAAAASVAWAVALTLVHSPSFAVRFERLGAMTGATLLLVGWQQLYQSRTCSSRLVEMARLVRVAIASSVVAVAVIRMTDSRAAVVPAVVGGLLAFVLLTTGRTFYDTWVRAERTRGRFSRPVAIVGSGAEAGRVIELFRHHPELGYRVCGVVGDRMAARGHGVDWLGDASDAVDRVLASGATGVVVVSQEFSSEELNQLLGEFLTNGIHVRMASGLWRIDHRRLQVTSLAHEPFLYLRPATLSRSQLLLKRALDITVASVVLILSAPTMLAAAAAVKLGDGGPVLFRQTRVGRGGRPFTLLKFRTMVTDAEARLDALSERNERQGPLFKVDADPRVTRVGKVLRSTSLDELPQLFNVLGGSMSLVGPRPALPEEVARFDADLLHRHRMPPGMTGLWQVEARDNVSFYAYRHLDLFYVENWSCALDVVVLANTVPVIITRALRSVLGRGTVLAEGTS